MIRDEDVSLGEDGSFSVRSSLPKTVLLALGSAAFVAASGWICVYWLSTIPAELATSSLTFVILTRLLTLPIFIGCLGGVLFFGYCLLFFVFRLVLFWRPVIEIGPRGIVDRASAVSAGYVPWDSVKDVAPVKSSGQDFVGITVKDERALLQRQNPVKRLAMRINSRFTDGAAVNVPLVGLPVTGEELLVEIRPHLDPPTQKRLDKHLARATVGDSASIQSKTDGNSIA